MPTFKMQRCVLLVSESAGKLTVRVHEKVKGAYKAPRGGYLYGTNFLEYTYKRLPALPVKITKSVKQIIIEAERENGNCEDCHQIICNCSGG